jgi:hypothetical protein
MSQDWRVEQIESQMKETQTVQKKKKTIIELIDTSKEAREKEREREREKQTEMMIVAACCRCSSRGNADDDDDRGQR